MPSPTRPAEPSPGQLDLFNGQRRPGRASDAPPRPPGRGGGGGGRAGPAPTPDTPLAEEAQRRYLNYALSVITSRALPDVRDGLKPVQRRILFTMLHDLHLGPDAKLRKSAAVVGEVMGKYHPHGNEAIYEAMVRLAQDFVLRAPLVHGHGNFGSADGDAPAAMRYTETKLLPEALLLLGELDRDTVAFRPNYDGTRHEPVVLPARFPNLLVNGSQGIAVGMATSIPPHNLGEVIDACVAMIDAEDELGVRKLLSFIKGPDFPTGGMLTATRQELTQVYESGSGSLRLRGEYRLEERKGGTTDIVLTSIPYAVERRVVVEKIAEVILQKKLPALVDVRDESTAEVRVVLETKRGADPHLVMAYLYKHTPLAVNVQVNLTCLVPIEGATVPAPRRLSLPEALRHFLDFRFEVVTRRLQHDLGALRRRIHVLEGFEIVFDALDETIRIIRKSEGKADAAQKLMKRFELSEAQVEAILELRLWKLARLEILLVKQELEEKRGEARRLEGLLKSEVKRWALVRAELLEVKASFHDRRRTKIVGAVDEPDYQAEDFIVEEDAIALLSAQGWLKRQREVKDLATTRVREGDTVLAVGAGSTRASVALFSNLGSCYTTRLADVPPSTGYGDPVQKLFKLGDGERMVAMLSFDPRALEVPPPSEGAVLPEPPFALALTRGGLGFRFSLRGHREPSTRAGRKFARLNAGDEVIAVLAAHKGDYVLCATSDGHALAVPIEDIPVFAGAGKGVIVMKVAEGERLLGGVLARSPRDALAVETEKGKAMEITRQRVEGSRAGRGEAIVRRDRFARVVVPPPALPEPGGPKKESG